MSRTLLSGTAVAQGFSSVCHLKASSALLAFAFRVFSSTLLAIADVSSCPQLPSFS